MNAKQLIAQFERISDAPHSVRQLQGLVLQLAIAGELVPQNPEDDPAGVLVSKTAKAQLDADSTGRRRRQSRQVHNTSEGGTVPTGWIRTQLGQVTISRDGERVPVSKEERKTRNKIYDYYGASGVIDKIDGYLFDKPLLLIGEDGANLVNRSTPIAFIARGKYWVNNHAHVLDAISIDLLRYLEVHINAIDLKPYLTGTAQPKMNQAKMNAIPISLPPLAEQKRIVQKVEELMTLCHELELAQTKREHRRDRLATSSQRRMVEATSDPETFRSAAFFYLKRLPRLATRPEHIAALRRTILDLGVRGRLVGQDSNDESATKLLSRVKEAQERQLQAGLIRRLPERKSQESDDRWSLPDSWEVAELGWLTVKIGAGSTPRGGKRAYVEGGVPFIRSQNVYNDGLRMEGVAQIPEAVHEQMAATHVQKDDILLNITGASIGRCALVPAHLDAANVSQHVSIIRLFLPAFREFVHLALISPFFQQRIQDVQVGVSREGLSARRLKEFLMPLPPLAEQERIVAKVNDLMGICDELETQLRGVLSKRSRLLEAVLHQTLQRAA